MSSTAPVIGAHHGALQGAAAWTPPVGLLGWWYGDLLSGDKWADRIGGNHMTKNSGTLSANGLAAGTATVGTPISNVTPFSFCCWIRQRDSAILSDASSYLIYADSNPLVYVRPTASGYVPWGTYPHAVWTHLAWTRSGNVHRLYFDGSEHSGSPKTLSGATSWITIGADYAITDVMDYHGTILTQAQIADICANSPGKPT